MTKNNTDTPNNDPKSGLLGADGKPVGESESSPTPDEPAYRTDLTPGTPQTVEHDDNGRPVDELPWEVKLNPTFGIGLPLLSTDPQALAQQCMQTVPHPVIGTPMPMLAIRPDVGLVWVETFHALARRDQEIEALRDAVAGLCKAILTNRDEDGREPLTLHEWWEGELIPTAEAALKRLHIEEGE